MANNRPLQLLFGAVLAASLFSVRADAQYFGRNKVNYENFKFRVLATEHFDLHVYTQDEQIARDVGRMAERWYDRYVPAFDNHTFHERKPIIIYSDHADFEQTNIISGFLSEGTGGVTESVKNRVVMPLTGDYASTDHVLGHELVHVFQYDIAATDEDTTGFHLNQLPLWLIEGMAEYMSVGRHDAHTAMWLRDAVVSGKFPTIKQLTTDPHFFPYRFGQALWAYIGGHWGDDKVTELYRTAGHRGFDFAIARVLGVTTDSLSSMWANAVKDTYVPAMEGREKYGQAGKKILSHDNAGQMNLAPTLSPDGKQVAFLSERDLFSIDVFLADAATGKVQKKLVNSATNGHFEALRFIDTAGSWSPDGKKFALVVFAHGDNDLLVFDVKSSKISKRYRPEDVGSVANPAWSPDGKTIAFSGTKDGISDLYLLDVKTGATTQITEGRYAETQPAWSPDGKWIAFVTDRGPNTDFEKLRYTPMRLGLIDLATKEVRILAPFEGAKHINPQFSPDGRSLFFISDPEGFSDIYRVDLDSEQAYRLTHVSTGVSGITATSPALSVARETGRVLFSVFENGKYNVYGIEPDSSQGEPVPSLAGTPNEGPTLADVSGQTPAPPVNGESGVTSMTTAAGILPPADEIGKVEVSDYLADPEGGLVSKDTFTFRRYKPKLQLDYIGGFAAGGVSTSQFGTGVAGGATAYFSDMLGNHIVGIGIQANGTFKDIGGQLSYLNRAHRWNWGGDIGHIPYLNILSSSFYKGDTLVVQDLHERVYLDRASLQTNYPFSQIRRLELSGAVTRYGYERQIQQQMLLPNGEITDVQTFDAPHQDALLLYQGSAALVGDNSYFGFTSPIQGYRYRVEVAPTFGSLNFVNVLLDYRRYILLRPFTLAWRGMHFGRYGVDAQDSQLSPLYLGYATLVRGYSSASFNPLEECTGQGQQDCFEFDRLIGSRIAVTNLELRFPFIGNSDFGLINFPYLPTELAGFVDGGLAWNKGEAFHIKWETDPSGLGTPERFPVWSAGGAAQVNLLGAIVLEGYLAFPFQRPNRNGVWGVQIVSGW
jgi:WD40 repeat protein/surface antigen Omp85-like protein